MPALFRPVRSGSGIAIEVAYSNWLDRQIHLAVDRHASCCRSFAVAQTRYTWCAIYVGQGALPVPPTWLEQGIFPLYRGDHYTDATCGELDADRACFLARVAGWSKGSVVYLDLEEGTDVRYVDAWINIVDLLGYRPGIRCTHAGLASVSDLGIDPTEWLFKACDATFERAEIFDEDDTQPWAH
jgi:hypothetical protein